MGITGRAPSRRFRPAGAALVGALLLVPALLSAQAPPYDQAIRASAALRLAAERSLDGASRRALVPDDVLAPKRRRDKQTGVTLMIIGGSAAVVGAVVGGGGGAVLILGGLAAAGYGFYLYTE